MRLTMRDVRATLAVGAAVVFYLLWSSGTLAGGMSTRVAAAIVFVLGWIGCTSDVVRMKDVYGADDARPALTYVVLTSLIGAIAMISGIVAMVAGSETALTGMVVATGGLWLLATVRHAFTAPTAVVHEMRHAPPLDKAA